MSREAMVVFGCDGPNCDSTSSTDEPFDFEPGDWYAVKPPGVSPIDQADPHHFCTLTCLVEWGSVLLGSEVGLT